MNGWKLKEARKGCACETMKDYKEGYSIVWTNYISPCSSIVELYFKGTCDVISVTMAMHKVHIKLIRWPTIFIYLMESSPKLFNFSDSKEKSYLVELNIFKENAFYGLQKILLDNFPRNF